MENNDIMNNITEEAVNTIDTTLTEPCSGKDLGFGMLIGAAITAGCYGAYKCIKAFVKRVKAEKAQAAIEGEAIELDKDDIDVK